LKVSRERRYENRRRILDEAARLFRERGSDRVSIDDVMTAAGLTHGGFYGHFASKDALIGAVTAHDSGIAAWSPPASRADYADRYLSVRHRDELATACPVSTLGLEASRGPAEARANLTARVRRMVAYFDEGASDGADAGERRRAAIATTVALVGGIVLARLVDDGPLSEEILAATRAELPLAN
jgi:TetR/AcrR family transcriptional repressor of nem operon